MASNTPRLNLYKKDPVADANDTFNIQTMLNDNWDRIDADVVLVSEKGQPNGVATLDANGKVVNADGSLPGGVTSVNNKTGAVTLSATDVGAETPDGAQEKADQAEQNAKAYTDTAPETMQRNLGIFNVSKSGKDSNGVFTTVDYKRANGTLYARSVLSNPDTNGNYQTRTITYYAADGSTVVRTDTWALTYDADGDLTSEVKA